MGNLKNGMEFPSNILNYQTFSLCLAVGNFNISFQDLCMHVHDIIGRG